MPHSLDTTHLPSGLKGGLVAGIVFGAMMGMMGMLPMVAMLVGSESAGLGFFVHIVFSLIIGAGFALTFGHKAARKSSDAMIWGLLYGFIWWILGPLIIMPIWLGMGIQLSLAGAQMSLPSLWGHLMFGFILGLVYHFSVSKQDLVK
ncbi:MAG: hypothetical protein HQ488_03915 [Parcubacteria group bacterium]|nr:hypothetical protein [Parcubacteria group bacterium]